MLKPQNQLLQNAMARDSMVQVTIEEHSNFGVDSPIRKIPRNQLVGIDSSEGLISLETRSEQGMTSVEVIPLSNIRKIIFSEHDPVPF